MVEVRRTKPTARFHGTEGSRSVLIRDGESAKIPLRLSGERVSFSKADTNPGSTALILPSHTQPWTITYEPPSANGRSSGPVRVTAQQPNAEIEIKRAVPGSYRLLSVRDKYCPGDVSETEWSVRTLPRPSLSLDEKAGRVVRNGSLVRPGVCLNTADSVPIRFEGKHRGTGRERFPR